MDSMFREWFGNTWLKRDDEGSVEHILRVIYTCENETQWAAVMLWAGRESKDYSPIERSQVSRAVHDKERLLNDPTRTTGAIRGSHNSM